MDVQIQDLSSPTEEILKILSQHLPYSLPLYRRLQFMDLPGGHTPNSHILTTLPSSSSSSSTPENKEEKEQKQHFAIAYLDFSRGPETEMWLYSSLENPTFNPMTTTTTTNNTKTTPTNQILSIIHHVKALETEYSITQTRSTPGIICTGSVNEKILFILQEQGLIKEATEPHFKFLFRREGLPVARELMDGLEWGKIRESDIDLVLSRTKIPRKARTVKLLPSAAIIEAGTPIAWTFLGPDGSLTSLHCEEQYRGKGLAKAVAVKLFRECPPEFGSDGWQHADVLVDNLQSQGVCKSLKGLSGWMIYWAWIDISGI